MSSDERRKIPLARQNSKQEKAVLIQTAGGGAFAARLEHFCKNAGISLKRLSSNPTAFAAKSQKHVVLLSMRAQHYSLALSQVDRISSPSKSSSINAKGSTRIPCINAARTYRHILLYCSTYNNASSSV